MVAVLWFGLFFACAGLCAPTSGNAANKFIADGQQLMAKKQHAAAVAMFEKATRANPRNEQAYFLLADAYAAQGGDVGVLVGRNKGTLQGEKYLMERDQFYKKALAALDKAIQLKPDFAQAYLYRGTMYSLLENHVLALKDELAALRIKPDFLEAMWECGQQYCQLGRHKEALKCFTECIRMDPKNWRSYYWRARTYDELCQRDLAVKDYTAALVRTNEPVDILIKRGEAYDGMGRHDLAIIDYNEYIKINPNEPIGYSHRGSAYGVMGKREAAKADFAKAAALGGARGF